MSEYIVNVMNFIALVVIAFTSFVLANFNQIARRQIRSLLREIVFVTLGGIASAQVVFYMAGYMWLYQGSDGFLYSAQITLVHNIAVAAAMFSFSWRAVTKTMQEKRERAAALNRSSARAK
jgi:hypothetical protein